MTQKMSFGVDEVDKLLGGGMIFGDGYLMEIEPGVEEMAFISAFLREGLRIRDFCAIVTFDRPHEELIERLTEFGLNAKEALESGSLVILDLWSNREYDPERKGPILTTNNVNDPNSAVRLYSDLVSIDQSRRRSGKFVGTRAVVSSLSSQIMNYRFEPTYKLMKIAINMSRRQEAVTLTLLSPKMFSETVVASFEHLFDGILVLTMKRVNSGFQRLIRVKQSPINSYNTDETQYEIVDNKPHLVT